jgi:hypothetical protein
MILSPIFRSNTLKKQVLELSTRPPQAKRLGDERLGTTLYVLVHDRRDGPLADAILSPIHRAEIPGKNFLTNHIVRASRPICLQIQTCTDGKVIGRPFNYKILSLRFMTTSVLLQRKALTLSIEERVQTTLRAEASSGWQILRAIRARSWQY